MKKYSCFYNIASPMEMKGIIGAIVFLALLMGAVQASEVDDLLDQLRDVPGVSVVPINDTAWTVVIGNLGVNPCEPTTFLGDCNPAADCARYGTCCQSSCNHCAARNGVSLCCKIKGCTNDYGVWCNNGGPCF